MSMNRDTNLFIELMITVSIGQYLLKYSATELRQATNEFSDECLIGSGAFGKVYAAHLRHTDVAVKIFMEVISRGGTDLAMTLLYG